MSELVERLTAEQSSPDKQLDRLFIGAGEYVRADQATATITRLQGALAAAEAERDEAKRLFETNIDRAENQWKAWEARATAAEAILAETRKKAMEEAAALIEANMLCGPEGTEVLLPRTNNGNKLGFAYAAAIRALAEEVRK